MQYLDLFLPIQALYSLIPSQVQSFLQQVLTDADSEGLTPVSMSDVLTEPCERAEDESLPTQKEDEKITDEIECEKTPPLSRRCEKSEKQQNIQPEPEERQDSDSDPRGELQPLDIPDFLLPDAPEDAEGGQHLAPCFYMIQMR